MAACAVPSLIVKPGSPPPAEARIRCVMMDLDGTIYEGDSLYPSSLPFFDALTRRGIAWGFVTNNTSRSIDSYVARLRGMGIPISGREQVVTPVLSVADSLRSEFPAFNRLFLLGTDDFRREMQSFGFEETADSPDDRPDAVITAFDKSLNYGRLCRAAWWIRNGGSGTVSRGLRRILTSSAPPPSGPGLWTAVRSRPAWRLPQVSGAGASSASRIPTCSR